MSSGQIVILSAPSGTGKSTIVAALRNRLPTLGYSVSLTTRIPRPNEQDGIHYHFVSRKNFLSRIAAGEMVEYVQIFDNFYGTSAKILRAAIDKNQDVLLEIDVKGAEQIKKSFPKAKLIFLLPPSQAELERRLRKRNTENEATIRLRLEAVTRELQKIYLFRYIIVNKEVEQTVNKVLAIISSDYLRITYIQNNLFACPPKKNLI